MSGRRLAHGAALRWLRWAPLIAGLVAFDRLDGPRALAAGTLVALAAALPCLLAQRRLTGEHGPPAPPAGWLEMALVWCCITTLIVAEAEAGNPGGLAGRVATVAIGLGIAAAAAQSIESRRGAEPIRA
jgi:hypothetical protein